MSRPDAAFRFDEGDRLIRPQAELPRLAASLGRSTNLWNDDPELSEKEKAIANQVAVDMKKRMPQAEVEGSIHDCMAMYEHRIARASDQRRDAARLENVGRFRKGRVGRLTTLGGLAARLAGGAMGSAGSLVTSGKDAALEKLHRRAARQLLDTMGAMKGLPMKVGQILSFMDGVVPPQYQPIYAELLGKLQVRTDPLPWEDMAAVLDAELERPHEEVFTSIDREPIAAASIGQVYRASIEDGREVAVKVQYPDINTAVRSDLSNVGAVIRTLAAVIPNFDNKTMVRDAMERLEEECDYRRECDHQRAFAAIWKDDPCVMVPEIVPALCSERVLVSELHTGESFGDVAATDDQDRKNAVGEVIFRFVFQSLLTHGVFNADPHPGNYLFPGDDRVVFLDFGCVQRFDDESRAAFGRLIDAVVTGTRGEALWDVIAESLQFPEGTSKGLREIIQDYLLLCFEPALAPQPFRYTRQYTAKVSKMTIEAKLKIAKSMLSMGWREPKREGVVMLGRILFGMNSLLAALESQADWRAMLRAEVEAAALPG